MRILEAQGMPRDIQVIRREHCEAFVQDQRHRHSASMSNTRYRSLQRFFGWADEEGEIDASPMRRMRPPKFEERVPGVREVVDLRRPLDASCSRPSGPYRRLCPRRPETHLGGNRLVHSLWRHEYRGLEYHHAGGCGSEREGHGRRVVWQIGDRVRVGLTETELERLEGAARALDEVLHDLAASGTAALIVNQPGYAFRTVGRMEQVLAHGSGFRFLLKW